MGNASSSPANAAPQPVVAENDSGSSRDRNDKDVDSSSDSSVFRLPTLPRLYRGERDAFLPININDLTEEDVRYHGGEQRTRSPPLLSISPRLSSNPNELISPLNYVSTVVSTPTRGERPQVNKANDSLSSPVSAAAERPPESSPPSVISSSDSSYGTCYSSLSSSQQTPGVSGSSRHCGQSGWLYSTYQNSGKNIDFPPSNHHRPALPLPKPIPKRDNASNGKGLFDCIKPIVAQPPEATATTQSVLHIKQHVTPISSLVSLTSLFETCIRPTEEENEYADDDCSTQGSYHSANNSYTRRQSYGRSLSNASQASQYSNLSHNSYYRSTSNNMSHVNSKASLVSAFSTATNASQLSSFHYTSEELNMVDGDEPTHESDLRRVRNYHVVTTAALPWMTGTAVNPLLRAGYLLRRNGELREQNEVQGSPVNIDGSSKGFNESIVKAPLWPRKDARAEQEDATPIKSNRKVWVERDKQEQTVDANEVDTRHKNSEDDDATTFWSPIEEEEPLALSDSHNIEAPQSPCSLDYSCFSFSEIDTPNRINSSPRELISPLGEEDSLLLSPLSPCEASTRMPLNDITNNKDVSKEEKQGDVTLVVPWLQDDSDRCMLYGSNSRKKEDGTEEEVPMFENQKEQEMYIRSWLAGEAGMPEEAKELNIIFYPARYHKRYNSIFALGDICDLIPNEATDVCILEEPEHLNWYRAPGNQSWSSKFSHCIGVIHTNYKAYARDHAPAGFLAAPLLAGVNSLVVRAHCHRVVKLSGVLQEFAPMSECVENVHGIRETYLKEGKRRGRMPTAGVEGSEGRKAYFIGKLLWAKGFDQLLELQSSFRERTGEYFDIDIYGSGPDEHEIKRAFDNEQGEESGILNNLSKKWSNSRRPSLPANFMGKLDHSSLGGDDYSIFVNPSLTEVLCTTTAEAIAMGKWAIIPSHLSNAFFVQFPNCLPYRNRREFVSTLKFALANDPPLMSDEFAHLLSWEAATMRCVHAAAVSKRDKERNDRISRAKEEKTLKKTLSGLWSGSKGDLQTMNDDRSSSSEPSAEDGSVAMITP